MTMSFLGDLVNSIGTNRPPTLPKPAPPRVPPSSSADQSNLAARPQLVPNVAAPPAAGAKRKLDERDAKIIEPIDRTPKSSSASVSTSRLSAKPSIPVSNGIKPMVSKPVSRPVSKPIPIDNSTTPSVPAKPPTKGSYAEMMARAKEAQQTKRPNPVGTIKHQASSKEKISRLAERRRQEHERLGKAKVEKDGRSSKSAPGKKSDPKRGTSPTKKNDSSKVSRAPRPPLHAPSTSYKGTMGTNSKKPREERVPRQSRYDQYLGTDEEDNSDADGYDDEDDGYDYGSDGSSDMEAGLDDIDMEEKNALRAAREDDAKELALENKLKREKDERKRKLEAMARRGR